MAYRQTEKTKARQQEVHQAIIDATLALLTKNGFAAVSIRAVAKQAGMATGSVYKHFASKAELCAKVFRLASEKELARVVAETQGKENPTLRLQKSVRGFSERAIKQPKLSYALIAEPVDTSVDAERIKLRQDYANAFAALIKQGIALREFVDQQADVSAAALVGIISETLVVPLSRQNTKLPAKRQAELIQSIEALCLRALCGNAP